jgi:ASC-1-like (ASCH) protein
MINLEEFEAYWEFLQHETTDIIRKDKRSIKEISENYHCSTYLIKAIQTTEQVWSVEDAIKIYRKFKADENA